MNVIICSSFYRDFLCKKVVPIKTVHSKVCFWKETLLLKYYLCYFFQCCEHHKLNSIHLHCTGVEEAMSSLGQMKSKLSAWLDTTRNKGKKMFFLCVCGHVLTHVVGT